MTVTRRKYSRLALKLVGTLTAVGLAVFGAGTPAHAATETFYHIVNNNSGLCLTIAGGSTSLNATAVQYNCDFHPSRYWRFFLA